MKETQIKICEIIIKNNGCAGLSCHGFCGPFKGTKCPLNPFENDEVFSCLGGKEVKMANLWLKANRDDDDTNNANLQQIQIHYDFTDGTELSYDEGILAKGGFTTNCLDFFTTDNPHAVVVRKDGKSIIVADLLEGIGNHTKKEIRKSHNIRKMLVSGALKFT